MPRSKRAPWRVYQDRFPGRIPSEDTLRDWRHEATARAKQLGAAGACDLCKRPVSHKYGYVWLKTPLAWRSRPKRRRICFSCFTKLDLLILEMEASGNRDDLSIEAVDLNPEPECDTSDTKPSASR